MRIESVSTMNMGMKPGMTQGMDATSKNIQSQIQNKQQELQKLSENEEMSLEEKMKKRQQVQQEIADLNMQLRQHQIEQRKEQQQSNGSSMDDMLGGKQQVRKGSQNGQSTGLSQTSMKAMISADSSMKQAAVQGSVATRMEGRAGVLEAEIKQDKGRGSTEAKEEELAEVTAKAANASASQMSTLSDANAAMEEARAAESTGDNDTQSGRTEDKKKASDDFDKTGREAQKDAVNREQNIGVQGTENQNVGTAEIHTEGSSVALPGDYVPVDVRL